MSTYIRSREIVEMAIAVPYSNETRIVKANDFNLRNFASNLNYLKHLRLRMSEVPAQLTICMVVVGQIHILHLSRRLYASPSCDTVIGAIQCGTEDLFRTVFGWKIDIVLISIIGYGNSIE